MTTTTSTQSTSDIPVSNRRTTRARVIGGQLDPGALRIVNALISAGGRYAGWRNNKHYVIRSGHSATANAQPVA